MLKKIVVISSILIISVHVQFAYAQVILETNGRPYTGKYKPIVRSLSYDDIEGSPYSDSRLMPGIVMFDTGDSLIYYLRYDIYSDEVEYLENEELLTITNKDELDFIILDDKKFVYKTYLINDREHSGYLVQSVTNQCSLFQKQRMDFQGAKPPKSSYEPGTPDQFVKRKVSWLYSCGNDPITLFSPENKSLAKIMGSYYKKVSRYMKENKLKPGREGDIILIFEYYNSLL